MQPALAFTRDKSIIAELPKKKSRRRAKRVESDSERATRITSYIKIKTKATLPLLDSLPIELANKCIFTRILCLGLGTLSSHISQFQLALLLNISEKYGVRVDGACDPSFGPVDVEILSSFSIPIIENLHGKYQASGDGCTLFYMPHCGISLYNALLWKNWANLDRVYILGNLFDGYYQSGSSKRLSSAKYVKAVEARVKWKSLDDFSENIAVFNNTGLQWFQLSSEHSDLFEEPEVDLEGEELW